MRTGLQNIPGDELDFVPKEPPVFLPDEARGTAKDWNLPDNVSAGSEDAALNWNVFGRRILTGLRCLRSEDKSTITTG